MNTRETPNPFWFCASKFRLEASLSQTRTTLEWAPWPLWSMFITSVFGDAGSQDPGIVHVVNALTPPDLTIPSLHLSSLSLSSAYMYHLSIYYLFIIYLYISSMCLCVYLSIYILPIIILSFGSYHFFQYINNSVFQLTKYRGTAVTPVPFPFHFPCNDGIQIVCGTPYDHSWVFRGLAKFWKECKWVCSPHPVKVTTYYLDCPSRSLL